jgi:hypothetical protein
VAAVGRRAHGARRAEAAAGDSVGATGRGA